MRRLERVAGLLQDLGRALRGHGADFLDDAGEGAALDELHRQEDQAVGGLAEIVDGADVGMVDPGRVGGLAVEPRDGVRIVRHGLRHHLDGALASHLHVLAEIDRAHAAFAQFLLDVIVAADDAAHEVGRAADVAEGRAVVGAELLIIRPLIATGRTDFH